ncbi:MAG: L,D-transpeptidase family protein [Jatrophihabitantaceae bacterium]
MKLPKSLLLMLAVALGLAGAAVLSSSQPAAASSTFHYQVVTVQASSAGATTARLDLWQRASNGAYAHVAGPVGAYVGELGMGTAREGIARTPVGVFGLTQAFGNQPTNGTKLPYFQAGPADWWDGESGTPAYNTHVHQSAAPGPASENLYSAGAVYAHAVVIDYNRFPAVAGAGSAFFLHVTNGQPTAGCVAISAYALNVVMRWLDPALHPAISIGVGAQATKLITDTNAAAATYNPRGHLDSVSTGHASAKLVGWAVDPDAKTSPVTIEVYFDGVLRGRFSTSVPRPDVAAAQHAGPNQGFSISFSTVAPGNRTICVHAVNLKLGTANPSLGCVLRKVT